MQELKVSLKTVTPLFLGGANQDEKAELRVAVLAPKVPNDFMGGANQDEKAELRAPSIKGALRFWYRAIDPDYRKHEEKIFGSTEHGQAGFLLRVSEKEVKRRPAENAPWIRKNTAYLGYGPITRDRKLKKPVATRPYIMPGSTFELLLYFKPNVEKPERIKVERALWALVTLGGLGSRSRKGFGSLMVEWIPKESSESLTWQFETRAKLSSAIEKFLKDETVPGGLPQHTCFSRASRCIVVHEAQTGEDALEWLGQEMLSYRSFKSRENVYGQKRFQGDHDLMRDYIAQGTTPPSPPLRAAFGLPHNYFFTSLNYAKGAVDLMDNGKAGRRASPVIFHIQGLTNGKSCVVATFLPAQLIPKNDKVRISGDRQNPAYIALPNDFSAVEGFMDRLAVNGKEASFL